MHCIKCGHPVDETAKFCTKCGSPVETEFESKKTVHFIKCTGCGTMVEDIDKYCYKCGIGLKEEIEEKVENIYPFFGKNGVEKITFIIAMIAFIFAVVPALPIVPIFGLIFSLVAISLETRNMIKSKYQKTFFVFVVAIISFVTNLGFYFYLYHVI